MVHGFPPLGSSAKIKKYGSVGCNLLKYEDTILDKSVKNQLLQQNHVETVGQQGYRFLGGEPALPPPLTTGPLVGRQREVAILEQWFQCHVG